MPTPEEKRAIHTEEKRKADLWSELEMDVNLTAEEANIASFLKNACVDITNPKDIELIRIQNPETGEYEPLDIPLWAEMDKQTAIGCVRTIKEYIDRGIKIYNFNDLKVSDSKQIGVLYLDKDKVTFNTKNLDVPNPPKEVTKPGTFKRFMNKIFGAFKGDFKTYDAYLEKKKEYDEIRAEVSKRQAVADEYSADIQEGREKYNIYLEVNRESGKYIPVEQSLRQAAETEEKQFVFQEVASGRSNVLLGRHKNYHDLMATPLKVYKRLPMAGLALLSGCAVEANAGVSDSSTQQIVALIGNTIPTEKEKELFKEMAAEANLSNIGGKVLETCYKGWDISRKGDRTEAIVKGRKMLNEAVESYSQNDKGPLINIVKQGIDILYRTMGSMSKGIAEPQAQAMSEIIDALDELFESDPEIKEAVGFPEEKMQALRGAAKVYKELTHKEERKYEEYKKDGGPNSIERKQIVEDRIFRAALFMIAANGVDAERNRAEAFARAEVEKPENQEMLARYDDRSDNIRIFTGLLCMHEDRVLKLPKMFFDMGDPDFDMEKYREAILAEARKTPEYQKYMEMEKDAFAQEKMDDIAAKVAKAAPAPLTGPTPTMVTNALETSARENAERMDDSDFDINEWRAKNTVTIPNK